MVMPIFQRRLLQVENHRRQPLSPLHDIAVEVVAALGGDIQGGVVVAVLDNFDMGSPKRLQRIQHLRAGRHLAEDRRPVHHLREPHHLVVRVAHRWLDPRRRYPARWPP